MNVIATTPSKLGLLSILTLACLTAACTSNVLGTGDGRQIDPSRGANGGDPSGSGSGSDDGSNGPSGTASGAPADIEALFAPPETETVTPGSVFGLWASSDPGTEDRLRMTKSDVTVARKCSIDGRIAYVTAKVRVNGERITVLESKSTSLPPVPNAATGTCGFTVKLDVEEWRICDPSNDYDYDCIRIEGTKLTGLVLPARYSSTDEWIKLSD